MNRPLSKGLQPRPEDACLGAPPYTAGGVRGEKGKGEESGLAVNIQLPGSSVTRENTMGTR